MRSDLIVGKEDKMEGNEGMKKLEGETCDHLLQKRSEDIKKV